MATPHLEPFSIMGDWYLVRRGTILVSDSVAKKFGLGKSIEFGIGKIWYRKKYRIQYRKNLVSEKVSDSVSFRFWESSHTNNLKK